MKFGRITRQLLVFAGAGLALLTGACRDDGLVDPPTQKDSCCATILVSAIDGRMMNPIGGVVGAKVQLSKDGQVVKTAETGRMGQAAFTGVCNGTYSIRIVKDGYKPAERGEVKVHGCDTVPVVFHMEPAGDPNDSCCNASLLVIPTTEAGEPIHGAVVTITLPDGSIRNTTSTQQGAQFNHLCPGRYPITISARGFKSLEGTVEVGCNREQLVRKVLLRGDMPPPDSCCHGKLVVAPKDGMSGELLNGAIVKLQHGDKVLGTFTIQGRPAVFDGLCAGAYSVLIHKEGYVDAVIELRMTCNAVVEREIRMMRMHPPPPPPPPPDHCCRNQVDVLVVDNHTGSPLAGAAVLLQLPNMPPLTIRTDRSGLATFQGVCEGVHGLVVEAEGRVRYESRLEVVCGKITRTVARLIPMKVPPPPPPPDNCCNAAFRFLVMAPTPNSNEGMPIMGVGVKIMDGDHVVATGMTNREGVFVKEGLCNNRVYRVLFMRNGAVGSTLEIPVRECKVYSQTVYLRP